MKKQKQLDYKPPKEKTINELLSKAVKSSNGGALGGALRGVTQLPPIMVSPPTKDIELEDVLHWAQRRIKELVVEHRFFLAVVFILVENVFLLVRLAR